MAAKVPKTPTKTRTSASEISPNTAICHMQLREFTGVCDLHHLPFLEPVVTSYRVFLQHPRELQEAERVTKRRYEFFDHDLLRYKKVLAYLLFLDAVLF